MRDRTSKGHQIVEMVLHGEEQAPPAHPRSDETPLRAVRRARVLTVGETDEFSTCLWTARSVPEFEAIGRVRSEEAVPDLVESLRPDLLLACCTAGASSVLELMRSLRDRDTHQCDVLLVVTCPRPDLMVSVARLGAFSSLAAPVDPVVLRRLLNTWLDRWDLTERRAPDDLLDQDEIDLVLHGRTTRGTARRPSTTPVSTLGIVASALRTDQGCLSASEVGGLCNLSAVATRRHLNRLVEQGLATMAVQYGKTGRPRHLYRWTT